MAQEAIKQPGRHPKVINFAVSLSAVTLKKANLVSESSILLPGIGTHKLQINSAMNCKLPLTERRAHSAASHQGRYNFTKPDSQGKRSSEGTLAGKKNFTFLFASPSVTSTELFLDYFSLSLFLAIIIFLKMYFWCLLSDAGTVHKSLIAERGIPVSNLSYLAPHEPAGPLPT